MTRDQAEAALLQANKPPDLVATYLDDAERSWTSGGTYWEALPDEATLIFDFELYEEVYRAPSEPS